MADKIKRETNRGFSVTQTEVTPPISATASEITLFSQVLDAGRMGVSKILDYKIVCNLVTPAVVLQTLTIKVKLGTSELILTSGLSLAANLTTGRPFIIQGQIANMNNSSTQYVYGVVQNYANNVPLILSASSALSDADWAVNTSISQTFSVTATFSALNAAVTIAPKIAVLDLS